MGDEKPWGTEGRTEIVPPTDEAIKQYKAARVRNPNLPSNPPLERGIALPLPSAEEPSEPGVFRAAGPSARPTGMNSDQMIDLDAKLRPEFEKTYNPEPTYNDQEQKFYDQHHTALEEEYGEKAQSLIASGELKDEEKSGWVSAQVFKRVRNFGKNLAYEEYRNKILETKNKKRDRPFRKPPGGIIGFQKYESDSPLVSTVERWRDLLKGDDWGFPCLRDPEFVQHFIEQVPASDEQDKYVLNTSAFLSGADRSSYDPHHVLVFRRSLPSEKPKPEVHWTTDYATAMRGLNNEIPAVHRLYTVILCTSLEDLYRAGLDNGGEIKAASDGEIKIKSEPFDQAKCIVKFRTSDQQDQLDAYLKNEGAETLESILSKLAESKTDKVTK